MRRHPRPGRKPLNLARTTALAAVVSLPLAALPATAAAAAAQEENNPPSRPLISELSTGRDACVSGLERPYAGEIPELSAVIRDPDTLPYESVSMTAQFEIFWEDSAGETQRRRLETTRDVSADGRQLEVAPSGLPSATMIGWRVRAHDGIEWGPWSSSGGQGPCEFVYDDERPEAASVTSAEYPDDETWHTGVGDYGHFTFDSPSHDVAAYRYQFSGETWQTVPAAQLGAAVTVPWVPESDAAYSLQVQAVDRAGNSSGRTQHSILVDKGRSPVGHWKLADAAGSGQAAAEAGTPAQAGTGVTFGEEGPARTDIPSAAALDGTVDAYLTPGAPAVDTTEPFAVATWVRPDSLNRDMTAVSQSGDGGAVSLGLNAGTGDPTWSFALPTASGTVRVEGGTATAVGHWTHLAGVYDPVAHTAELFVNGTSVAQAEDVTATATGALQIGRAGGADGYTGNWDGALADVRVWDRLVFEDRLSRLSHREAVRTGYWQFDEAADGRSPEYAGGQDFVLGGDAHVPPPNCAPDDIFCTPEAVEGASSLHLDGLGDHAATAKPVIDSDGSFTLAARVRFDSSPTRDMTVFSLPGAHTNALVLRYSADSYEWELAVTDADAAGAQVTTVASWAYNETAPYGDHLAVTYDASTGALKLYVNAQQEADATVQADLWSAEGGLQVGRSLASDGWGGQLAGAVDEVRSYTGALSEVEISRVRMGGPNV